MTTMTEQPPVPLLCVYCQEPLTRADVLEGFCSVACFQATCRLCGVSPPQIKEIHDHD